MHCLRVRCPPKTSLTPVQEIEDDEADEEEVEEEEDDDDDEDVEEVAVAVASCWRFTSANRHRSSSAVQGPNLRGAFSALLSRPMPACQ